MVQLYSTLEAGARTRANWVNRPKSRNHYAATFSIHCSCIFRWPRKTWLPTQSISKVENISKKNIFDRWNRFKFHKLWKRIVSPFFYFKSKSWKVIGFEFHNSSCNALPFHWLSIVSQILNNILVNPKFKNLCLRIKMLILAFLCRFLLSAFNFF